MSPPQMLHREERTTAPAKPAVLEVVSFCVGWNGLEWGGSTEEEILCVVSCPLVI
jgi:hypothetical protein